MAVYFNKEEELEHRIELLEIAMGNVQLAMGESNNKGIATLPINSVSQQRGLLVAFANYIQSDTANLNHDFTDLVEIFLSNQ